VGIEVFIDSGDDVDEYISCFLSVANEAHVADDVRRCHLSHTIKATPAAPTIVVEIPIQRALLGLRFPKVLERRLGHSPRDAGDVFLLDGLQRQEDEIAIKLGLLSLLWGWLGAIIV